MSFRKNFGNDGEVLARKFLESRGVEILETNFHTREGEVDIIAKDGETIIFLEVKARRSDKFGSAMEAVDDAKIEKIVSAGESYLTQNSLEDSDWRVDAITIEGGKLKWVKGI